VFVTHGEPEAADSLRKAIEERVGCQAEVPEFAVTHELI
jgi:metallo-beta-lactamase family protein